MAKKAVLAAKDALDAALIHLEGEGVVETLDSILSFSVNLGVNVVVVASDHKKYVILWSDVNGDVEKIAIEVLRIPGVPRNVVEALIKAGFTMVSDLEGIDEAMLLSIDGVGQAVLKRIRDFVA